MKNLLLHKTTNKQLDNLLASPSHAVMLVGPNGSGKKTLATELSESILKIDDVGSYPYKLLLEPADGKSIGIEAIREVEHFLRLKVPRQAEYSRAIIIRQAESLTLEAQNALLKNLEEPPGGTLIILCTSFAQSLLPTIRSRCQSITIKQPPVEDIYDFFRKQGYDQQDVEQAYAISGGLPGLIQALLDDADHPLLLATLKARDIVKSTVYERLMIVDDLARQKTLAQDTVYILGRMARVSLNKASGPTAQKWQDILVASYEAAKALSASVQPKLVLTSLFLSF